MEHEINLPEADFVGQNFLIKYDKAGEYFKLGFMAQRQNARGGELLHYPIWIARIVGSSKLARRMFDDVVWAELLANPDVPFWIRFEVSPVMDALQKRVVPEREFAFNSLSALFQAV